MGETSSSLSRSAGTSDLRDFVLIWIAEYHAGGITIEMCLYYDKNNISSVIKQFPFQGGIYFFQLIDHYAASMTIMFLAFFEVIAISWLYGVRRLCNNVKEMTGRLPSMYFRFCWFLAAPLLIMVRNK
jgi:SNF family Na+-dependent transporter